MKFWKVLCETTVFWRHVRRFSALSKTSLCVETVSFFAHKLDPRQAILKRACEESQGPFVSASHSFCVVTACCAACWRPVSDSWSEAASSILRLVPQATRRKVRLCSQSPIVKKWSPLTPVRNFRFHHLHLSPARFAGQLLSSLVRIHVFSAWVLTLKVSLIELRQPSLWPCTNHELLHKEAALLERFELHKWRLEYCL